MSSRPSNRTFFLSFLVVSLLLAGLVRRQDTRVL